LAIQKSGTACRRSISEHEPGRHVSSMTYSSDQIPDERPSTQIAIASYQS